jgi:hypothetical protein
MMALCSKRSYRRGPDEFFDTDAKLSGIASIEEVLRAGAERAVFARLNGDQSNHGRQPRGAGCQPAAD